MKFLEGAGILEPQHRLELDELRKLRNDVVHGVTDYRTVITREVVERMKRLADLFEEDAEDEDHERVGS
jgi:uncharacterized protein YutE (UPF0331/DUF86 family)